MQWRLKGSPNPPPKEFKAELIKRFQNKYRLKTLVETGTYYGETIAAVKDRFEKIYSIELDDTLYKKTKEKFNTSPNISILHGNSETVLPELLGSISGPCIFWLDGHFSSEATAKADKETPIVGEITTISDHPVKNHIILIDDARCFTGQNDYPSLENLFALLKKVNPHFKIEVKDDIIRAYEE